MFSTLLHEHEHNNRRESLLNVAIATHFLCTCIMSVTVKGLTEGPVSRPISVILLLNPFNLQLRNIITLCIVTKSAKRFTVLSGSHIQRAVICIGLLQVEEKVVILKGTFYCVRYAKFTPDY